MRIDLHTHSYRSDGTTSPREVVLAAGRAGLDVVALTDHDTASGWEEAAQTAYDIGVGLVRGIEISCRHRGRSVHLLAYLPDPSYPPLRNMLSGILDGRTQRLPAICAALRAEGIDIEEAEVKKQDAEATATGRPHVADVLIGKGVVDDRDEAFERYLAPGRPGYVSRYAPSLSEAMIVVREAGGVPVVAHPWGRGSEAILDEPTLGALAEEGLEGLEAHHQDHTPRQRQELVDIAARLGLIATGASDFHGAGKRDHELGCHTTAPDELERLLVTAEELAKASGRDTPRMLTS